MAFKNSFLEKVVMDGLFLEKFPFTEKAKQELKKMNISLEGVPERAIKKAALMISKANANKNMT